MYIVPKPMMADIKPNTIMARPMAISVTGAPSKYFHRVRPEPLNANNTPAPRTNTNGTNY